jgi:hypothetical protein
LQKEYDVVKKESSLLWGPQEIKVFAFSDFPSEAGLQKKAEPLPIFKTTNRVG